MSKQLLRSGTAIGALIREAEFAESKKDFIHKLHISEFAESKKDFIHKLHISLKEANETDYWLTLLHESDYINDIAFQSIQTDCTELIKLLTCFQKN